MRRPNGFSLIELVIALTVLGVIMTGVVSLTVSAQRSQTRHQRDIRAEETLQAAEAVVMTVLRTAGADPLRTSTPRFYSNPLAAARFDNIRATADFNPADGDINDPLEDVLIRKLGDSLMVRWQAGGALQAAAFPIDSLRFEYFSSRGTALTTTALADTATRVRFTIAARGADGPRRLQRWVYMRN